MTTSSSGSDSKKTQYEAKCEIGVLVILDIAEDPSLIQEGLARELVNRVQRLRKKAGLQPTDDVTYLLNILADPESRLSGVLSEQKEYLFKSLKQEFLSIDKKSSATEVISEEEQEVSYHHILLNFDILLCLMIDICRLKALNLSCALFVE